MKGGFQPKSPKKMTQKKKKNRSKSSSRKSVSYIGGRKRRGTAKQTLFSDWFTPMKL
jgi:hypothetical protein